MNAPETIIAPRWLAAMPGPAVQHAAVLISHRRIKAVQPLADLVREYPRAEVVELPQSVLLPGLVNAHVHLELTHLNASPIPPAARFIDWIAAVRDRMRLAADTVHSTIAASVTQGIDQSVRCGVTTVADITSFIEISRPILQHAPLRAISFGEALGLGKLREKFEQAIPRALGRECESETCRIGLSPHAPFSVDWPGYEQCVGLAETEHIPLATHLAENLEEEVFLKTRSGDFRELWDRIGLWDESVKTFPGSPVAFAAAIGLLKLPTILAHANYASDADLATLATGRASVVYCPRTHRYFGHAPHRWQEMLALGINVAVGTDSCASSPNLNLLEDLQLLRQQAPQLPAETIWQLATLNGANALRMGSSVGTIAAGKFADLIAFNVDSDDPLQELLREPRPPVQQWFAGSERLATA